MNGEPSTLVSPGIWGFLAFFVLAVALYLLMRNMNARMRRMSYRAQERQQQAEDAARGGAQEPGASGPRTPDHNGGDREGVGDAELGDEPPQP